MTFKKNVFIWGAGGQGRIILDILKQNKEVKICGFIDSNKEIWGKTIDKIKILGGKDELQKLKKRGIKMGFVAIGDNKIRSEIARYLNKQGFSLINVIHPKAIVAKNVLLGQNIAICMGALVATGAVIKDNVIINSGAIIEHQNIIENGAHIASGAKLAGHVIVGEKAFVGIGSTVIQYKKIGENSIIGAGAVVIKDIPNNVAAVGVPAKIIKHF